MPTDLLEANRQDLMGSKYLLNGKKIRFIGMDSRKFVFSNRIKKNDEIYGFRVISSINQISITFGVAIRRDKTSSMYIFPEQTF